MYTGRFLGDLFRISYQENFLELKKLLKENKPFIINNLCNNWPAKNLWDLDYFYKTVGNNTISYVEMNENNITTYNKIHQMQMSGFLDEINQIISNKNNFQEKKLLYLVISRIMSHPNRKSPQLSSLLKDINIPNFIPFDRLWQINLWMGIGANKSNLHFDPEENLLTIISGSKRVLLFPPNQKKFLYQNNTPGSNFLQSQVDVFNFDHAKFSLANKACYYETTLYAGETLYIPAGWWHAVESSSSLNIAVNMWWLVNPSYLLKFYSPVTKQIFRIKHKWHSVLFPNILNNLGEKIKA